MRRRQLLQAAAPLIVGACTPGPATRTPVVGSSRVAIADPISLVLTLPARPARAESASELVDRLARLRAGEREEAIVEAYLAGNIPDFLRTLVEVPLAANGLSSSVFVTPDYLALGSNDDWLRVPCTIRGARTIAKAASCVLPTRRVVDAIHERAIERIASPYMPPGRDMSSVGYYVTHQLAIERQRSDQPQNGQLVSGHKKDIVISKRELETPSRTPIYGWFRDDGSAIQPLSLLHDHRYVDYAHGIRLVHGRIRTDGREVDFLDALEDRKLSALISDEGRFAYRLSWTRGY